MALVNFKRGTKPADTSQLSADTIYFLKDGDSYGIWLGEVQYAGNFSSLEEAIESLQSDLEDLQDTVGELDETVNSIESDVTDLQTGLGAAKKDIEDIKKDYLTKAVADETYAKLEDIEDFITDEDIKDFVTTTTFNGLKETVDGHTTSIETLTSDVSEAKQKANEAAGTAKTAAENAADAVKEAGEAKTAATNAQTTATNANTAAGEAKEAAGEAKEAAETATSTANTAKSTADTAKQTADAAKQAAETNAAAIEEIEDDITKIQKEQGTQNSKIDALETWLGKYYAAGTDHKENLEAVIADIRSKAEGAIQSLTKADDSVVITGTTGPDATIKVNVDPAVDNALKLGANGLKVTIPEQTNYTVTVTEGTDSTDTYAKVYEIKQEATGLNAKINIPKDMVVSSGSVVDEGEDGEEGTFIKLVLNNGNELYINVADLVDQVTADNTSSTVTVTVTDNAVKAEVKNGSIGTTQLAQGVNEQISLGVAANTALTWGTVGDTE